MPPFASKDSRCYGDTRTFEYTCLLRAVTSEDGMTAAKYSLPMNI